MNFHRDVRLALAAFLVIFSVGPATSAVFMIVTADQLRQGSVLESYFTAALNLLAAVAGFGVAFWLFQRSRREWDDAGEECEDLEE